MQLQTLQSLTEAAEGTGASRMLRKVYPTTNVEYYTQVPPAKVSWWIIIFFGSLPFSIYIRFGLCLEEPKAMSSLSVMASYTVVSPIVDLSLYHLSFSGEPGRFWGPSCL